MLLTAPVLPLLVGDEFDGSVEMIRWLVLWLPFKTVAQPPLAGLLGLGRLGVRLVILCATAGLSMALYLILIPDMGWEGAVIGTVVAEAALAALGGMALVWAQGKRDAELAAAKEAEDVAKTQAQALRASGATEAAGTCQRFELKRKCCFPSKSRTILIIAFAS